MKKSIRVLLSLALALVLALGCASAAFAEEAAPAEETVAVEEAPVVDIDLVGPWAYYAVEVTNGYDGYLINLLKSMDIILPNGVMTSSDDFSYVNAAGADQLTATAANGETDLGENLVNYILMISEVEGLEVSEDLVEEAKKLSDVVITYERFDFNPEDAALIHFTDAKKELYTKSTFDGLRLHVTGKYKQDPLTTKAFDMTYSYYADIPTSSFYECLLSGDWTDQNGNSWHFGYEFGDDGYPDFAFLLTTEDGTEYVGEYIYGSSEIKEEGYVECGVSFDFDSFDSPDYVLSDLSENTVTFTSEDGDLILTRA